MRLLLLGFALLLLSCSTTAPQRTEYFLRYAAAETNSAELAQARVGLRRVGLAAYVDQRGLVIETGANELRPAQSHVWAEPLDQGLLLFLRGAIASALGEDVGLARGRATGWEQSVDVYVEQLHGTMSGSALLVASFEIKQGGEPGAASEFRFARSMPLPAEGYAGLVEAQKQLATELAAAIAAALASLR